MSSSHVIMLPRIVTAVELMEFTVAEGGTWQDWMRGVEFRQGVIVSGDTWLFIRGVDSQEDDRRFFSPEDLACAALACGHPIAAVLTVDHTKTAVGEALAKTTIAHMISRWGGGEFDVGQEKS